VGGEAVAKGVRPHRFDDAGLLSGFAHRFLQGAGAHVPAPDDTAFRVFCQTGRGEHELPTPFTMSVGILSLQSVGKMHVSIALGEIAIVDAFDPSQVFLQRRH